MKTRQEPRFETVPLICHKTGTGGEKQERRNQNLQSLIFRFTVLQIWSLLRPLGILVAKAVGNLLSSDPCAVDLFLFFCLLIFGPKFVVHQAINRGRGGGLLARFILNITIC